MRKKFFLFFLFLTVILLTPITAQAKAEKQTRKVIKNEGDFSVKVEYGLNGYATYDNRVPVTVKVKSKEDFTGKLCLTPILEESSVVGSYGEVVTLPADTEKTVTLIVEPSRVMYLHLYDEKDKKVYEEKETLRLKSAGSNLVMGILSKDYGALSYIDGVKAEIRSFSGLVHTLELNAENFPSDVEILKNMQYLLIDNYDTAQLSKEQYEALKTWVNQGGILLVATGANYQNALHMFSDDFLSGTFDDLKKQTLAWKENTDGKNMTKVQGADLLSMKVKDAKPMKMFLDDTVAAKKKSELGAIVVLSFDLGMEPVCSIAEEKKKALVETLISEAAQPQVESILQNEQSMGMGDMETGEMIAELLDEGKRPSALLVGIGLLCYVVLVGPLLYLILKKIGKRNYLWGFIPLIAAGGMIGLYVTGSVYRIQNPLQNNVAVLDVQKNKVNETIFTDMMCPSAKEYNFTMADEFQNAQVKQSYYNGFDTNSIVVGKNPENPDWLFLKNGEKKEWKLWSKTVFDEIYMQTSRVRENNLGEIKLDLSCNTKNFSGTVTNQTGYDLKNVVVCFDQRYFMAGDLKKGESVKVDAKKLLEDISGYGECIYDYYEKKLETNGEDKELYLNQQIDTFMQSKSNQSQNNQGGQGCVWAQLDGYKCNLLKKGESKVSSIGIYYRTFEEKYTDVKGSYYSNIAAVETGRDGEIDNGRYIYEDVKVTYSFEKEKITQLCNRSFEQAKDSNCEEIYADVEAYNAKNNKFEPIFTTEKIIDGDELKKYINHGVMILRYRVPAGNKDETVVLPYISAKGEK